MFKVRLNHQTDRSKPRRIKVAAGVTLIGRHEKCTLRIDDQRLSRRHCIMEVRPLEVVIRDCNSRNGTFVNDRRIGQEDTVVYHGDRLRIGPHSFRLSIRNTDDNRPVRPDELLVESDVNSSQTLDRLLSELESMSVQQTLSPLDDQVESSPKSKSPSTEDQRDRGKRFDRQADAIDKTGDADVSKDADQTTLDDGPGRLPDHLRKSQSVNSQDAASAALKKHFNSR